VNVGGTNDVKIGTGTFNNPSAAADLYVTGNLEVDGTIYGNLQNSVSAGTGLTGGSFNNSANATFAVDQAYNFAWTGNQTWAGTSTFNNAVNVGGTNDVKIGTGIFNNPSPAADLYVTGNIEADGTIYGTLGTALPGTLSNGAGIAAFTYNGLASAVVAIDYSAPGTWTGTQTFSAAGNGIVVTTNANFQGNIENSMGDLQVNDNVVPFIDNNYDLGSSSKRWNDIFLGGNIFVEGYIQNPGGSVTVNDALVVSNGATIQNGGLTVQNGGATIQAGGLTVQSGGATIQNGDLEMGTGYIKSTGSTVTVDDNLQVNNHLTVGQKLYLSYTNVGAISQLPFAGNFDVVYYTDGGNPTIILINLPAETTNGRVFYIVNGTLGNIFVLGTTIPPGGVATLIYAGGTWNVSN
jgi:hypothetical protein